MKDKLIRFIDNINGNFVEVSYSPALYQCYDLFYLWCFVLDIPKSAVQHQYAYEAYTQATELTRQYFDLIPNLKETIPQEGDVVVWNKTSGNIAGHIAVVVEATQDKMKVFEQNAPLGTNAHIGDKTYTNCLGFLRPKFQISKAVPQWFENLLIENNLSLENEGGFRQSWEKLVKYDSDVKSLQEQVKSANEALADRALEVSVLIEKNQKLSDKITETEEIANLTRSKNDTLSWENTQLKLQNEELASKCASLEEQIEKLQTEKPLYGYTFWERLKSIFKLW